MSDPIMSPPRECRDPWTDPAAADELFAALACDDQPVRFLCGRCEYQSEAQVSAECHGPEE